MSNRLYIYGNIMWIDIIEHEEFRFVLHVVVNTDANFLRLVDFLKFKPGSKIDFSIDFLVTELIDHLKWPLERKIKVSIDH